MTQDDREPSSESEDIRTLLQQYQRLRSGGGGAFMEEDAFERIIDHFDEQEDFKKALEAVDLSLDYFPYSSALMLRKADTLLSLRKYREALHLLDKAASFDTGDINLYILKTDAYLALEQHELAVSILEEAIGRFEGDDRIELLFELSDVYDDYEEFDKVFDCLKLILEEQPTCEEALYKICFWTDYTGRSEESIRLHLKIIDDHPYSELAWFNLGAAYQGLNLFEKAIDAYQYAIAIDEKFDYAYRNIGDACIRLRRYKDAIEALEKVLELAKPEEVIYDAIGYCYDRLKNFAQARIYYRKASHLAPDDSRAYYKIACTYFNEGAWLAATKHLDTALRIHRKKAEYHLLMGECRLELKQLKEAVMHFTTAVRLKPKNVRNWESLVRCLYAAGMHTEARQQAQTAFSLTGNKPIFLYYTALALFGLGKSKEALVQLETALQVAPRLLSRALSLHPALLQLTGVVDLIARYKRKK